MSGATMGAGPSSPLTATGTIHFGRRGRGGRKELRAGPAPAVEAGRVPRISRLMALAIKIESLVRQGVAEDYATIARLGHVSRARVSQIISLLNLASDLQEVVLHLPVIERGRDPLALRDMLPIAAERDWAAQRRMWAALRVRAGV